MKEQTKVDEALGAALDLIEEEDLRTEEADIVKNQIRDALTSGKLGHLREKWYQIICDLDFSSVKEEIELLEKLEEAFENKIEITGDVKRYVIPNLIKDWKEAKLKKVKIYKCRQCGIKSDSKEALVIKTGCPQI